MVLPIMIVMIMISIMIVISIIRMMITIVIMSMLFIVINMMMKAIYRFGTNVITDGWNTMLLKVDLSSLS